MKILLEIIIILLFALFSIGSFMVANMSDNNKTMGGKNGKDN